MPLLAPVIMKTLGAMASRLCNLGKETEDARFRDTFGLGCWRLICASLGGAPATGALTQLVVGHSCTHVMPSHLHLTTLYRHFGL